jgi:hypothetical protein
MVLLFVDPACSVHPPGCGGLTDGGERRSATPKQKREGTGHSHDKPLPLVEEHLAGPAAAGFEDVAMPWRSFYPVLFIARKAG